MSATSCGRRIVLLAGLTLALWAPPRAWAADPPAWQPNAAYGVGALVVYNALTYKCVQAHTSQVGWEPPKVYNLWLRPTPQHPRLWQAQTPYPVGRHAIYKGRMYDCIQAHTSQPTWTPDVTPALWQDVGPLPSGATLNSRAAQIYNQTFHDQAYGKATEAAISALGLSSSVAAQVRTIRSSALNSQHQILAGTSLTYPQKRHQLTLLEVDTKSKLMAAMGGGTSRYVSFMDAVQASLEKSVKDATGTAAGVGQLY
jgi:hypothetical protein